MDLLLIDPVTTARTVPLGTRRSLRRGIGYPGLGLVTVAALTPPDVRVRVIDEAVEEIDPAAAPGLVGITVQAPAAPRAYALADGFRSRGVPVVLGGIHASLNPQEAAAHADAVVIGEAELTWPRLIDDFRRGRLQAVYRAGGLADLYASPRPRRDLLRARDYRLPQVVQFSRGCPWGCEFCSLHAYLGGTPRFRTVARVVEEIRALPGREILFADDNIYADPPRTIELLRALVPLRRRWVAETTWHIAGDAEALALARRASCAGLFVGFDAINEQRLIRKAPPDAERVYVEAMRAIRAAGIPVVAAFVFGLDNDDATVFERSLEVAEDGGAALVNFSALVPYPGTPVYRRLEAEGRIVERDWARYISPNVCFRPARMSAAELRAGVMRAQRRFYAGGGIARRALGATLRFGWGAGLVSLALNVSQRRNWGQGSVANREVS